MLGLNFDHEPGEQNMETDISDELLNELLEALETVDTQSAAILQFLKDKGIADDEQLAPYLQQAGNASDVRGRALRIRIHSLLSSAAKKMEETIAQKAEESAKKAVAAELDAEKPRRRRRKETVDKQAEGGDEKSKQPQAAGSTDTNAQAGSSGKSQIPKATAEEKLKDEPKSDVAIHEKEQNREDEGKPRNQKEGEKKIA